MSWEDQVQEEEQQRWGGSITESSPELDTPPPASEEGNASDVSMINDGPTQHDLDIMVKEEREEDMETGTPVSSTTPMPPKELPMQEGSEARDVVWDDQFSQMSEETTDQNPPHDSDLNEDELLGMVTNISVPRGHSDDSIALIIPPGEDNL